ncbi:MAG: phage tail protein [Pseudomonadota bacterium]
MAVSLFLGTIPIGTDIFTGPTGEGEAFEAPFPQHDVARGKPQIQDVGSDLDVRNMEFFFDEGFCDPQAERAKLFAAFLARTSLPLIRPGTPFSGTRYVIDRLSVKSLATTPSGRLVRCDAQMSLLEDPLPGFSFGGLSTSFGVGPVTVNAAVAGGGGGVGFDLGPAVQSGVTGRSVTLANGVAASSNTLNPFARFG